MRSKRILSGLCALAMTAGLLPVPEVFANTEETAKTIALDKSDSVTFNDENSEWWYTFTAPEASTYCFYSTGDTDTRIHMMDSQMEEVDSDDDGGTGRNFSLKKIMAAGEKVYFYVDTYENSYGSAAINVTYDPLIELSKNAQDIALNGSKTVSFNDELNAAYLLHFKAPQAGTYGFSVTSGYKVYMDAFDAGTYLSLDEKYDHYEDGVTNNDTMYVGLDAGQEILVYAHSELYGDEGLHPFDATITVKNASVPIKSNTSATAVEVKYGEGGKALHYYGEDTYEDTEHWFVFTAADSGYYKITSSGYTDVRAILYDSSLNEIDSDDDSGEKSNFAFRRHFNKGEKVYIKVLSHEDGDSYVEVTDDDTMKKSNTAATAVHISPKETYYMSFSEKGQEYWYSIDGDYEYSYTAESGGDTDLMVTLYDKDLNKVSEDDDSGVNNNFHLKFDGKYDSENDADYSTFYLKVTNVNGDLGDSTLYVNRSSFEDDDYDDPDEPDEPDEPGDETKAYGDLYYQELSNGEIAITGCNKSKASFTVPSQIDGKTVTVIGPEAFGKGYETNKKITSITLPNTIKSIGYGAFANLPNLTTLNLPDSIESLSSDTVDGTGLNVTEQDHVLYYQGYVVGTTLSTDTAFVSDNNPDGVSAKTVTSLTFPEGTKGICAHAFTYCFNLEEVTFPASLRFIGEAAFGDPNPQTGDDGTNGLPKLHKVTFKGNNLKVINDYAFCSGSYLSGFTLPTSVERIGRLAFAYTPIHRLDLPSALKEVNLYGMDNLSTVIIPSGVTELKAFSLDIPAVYVPNTVKSINTAAMCNMNAFGFGVDNTLYYGGTEADFKSKLSNEGWDSGDDGDSEELSFKGNVVYNCSLKTVDGITYVLTPDEAVLFSAATTLSSVNIPATVNNLPVKRVEAGAFKGCDKLKTVTIPSTVSEVGEDAFDYCTALESVTFPKGAKLPDVTLEAKEPDEPFVFSNAAANGIEDLFDGCSALKTINFDKNDPNYMFSGGAVYSKSPQALLFVPETARKLEVLDGTTIIADYAAENCKNLKVWYGLPKTVTKIGGHAFMATGFTRVVLPDTVKEVGEYAFASSMSLKECVLSKGMTEIPNNMFGGCSALAEIVVPDSVKEIGDEAFYNCTSLTKAYIPASVGYMVDNNLTEVDKTGTKLAMNSDTALNMNDDDSKWFTFTADNEGYYRFYSTGTGDPVLTLLDGEGHTLKINDDAEDAEGENYNFDLTYHMTKGQTVYLKFTSNDDWDGALHITTGEAYDYSDEANKEYEPDWEFKGLGSNLFHYPDPNGPYTWSTAVMPQVTVYGIAGSTIEEYCKGQRSMIVVDDEEPEMENVLKFQAVTAAALAAKRPATITSGSFVYKYGEKGTIQIVQNKNGAAVPAVIDGIAVENAAAGETIAITLKALDSKLKAENATVFIDGVEAAVSENGEFVLPALSDGTHVFRFAADNFVERSYTVTVSGGKITTDLQPELHLIGDITGDGNLNAADLLRAKSHLKGVSKLTGYDLEVAASADGKNTLTAADLLKMKSHIKGVSKLW